MRHTRTDEDRAQPCDHTLTGRDGRDSWLSWCNAHDTPTHESQGVLMRCLFCHAQMPLGPANDRGVPAVEMRLADALARLGPPETVPALELETVYLFDACVDFPLVAGGAVQ